jgi:hypothetical protein
MSGFYIIPAPSDFLSLSGGTVSGNTLFTQNLSGANIFITSGLTQNESLNQLVVFNTTTGQLEFRDATNLAANFTGGTVAGNTSFLQNLSGSSLFITSALTQNNSLNQVVVYNSTTSQLEFRDASTIGTVGNFVHITGDTMTGLLVVPSLSGQSISGDTIFSGSTPIQDIFPYSGTNIGNGTGLVFSQKNNGLLEFRTFSAGTKISITGSTDTVVIQTSGVNSYYIQTFAPSGSTQVPLIDGDRWFNTTHGLEFVYIDDGDSSAWVEIFAPTPQYPNLGTFEITSNTYNLTYDYFYYGINYDGPVDLFLPSCAANDGKKITVKDELGKCNQAGKRIRISGFTGQNIDGNNYVDMAISKMGLQFISRGNNWHLI